MGVGRATRHRLRRRRRSIRAGNIARNLEFTMRYLVGLKNLTTTKLFSLASTTNSGLTSIASLLGTVLFRTLLRTNNHILPQRSIFYFHFSLFLFIFIFIFILIFFALKLLFGLVKLLPHLSFLVYLFPEILDVWYFLNHVLNYLFSCCAVS